MILLKLNYIEQIGLGGFTAWCQQNKYKIGIWNQPDHKYHEGWLQYVQKYIFIFIRRLSLPAQEVSQE